MEQKKEKKGRLKVRREAWVGLWRSTPIPSWAWVPPSLEDSPLLSLSLQAPGPGLRPP